MTLVQMPYCLFACCELIEHKTNKSYSGKNSLWIFKLLGAKNFCGDAFMMVLIIEMELVSKTRLQLTYMASNDDRKVIVHTHILEQTVS